MADAYTQNRTDNFNERIVNGHSIPRQNDLGEAWQCDWEPEAGSRCEVKGTLRQRGGTPYYVHNCYGHEFSGERKFLRQYIICQGHHRLFLGSHEDIGTTVRGQEFAERYGVGRPSTGP